MCDEVLMAQHKIAVISGLFAKEFNSLAPGGFLINFQMSDFQANFGV